MRPCLGWPGAVLAAQPVGVGLGPSILPPQDLRYGVWAPLAQAVTLRLGNGNSAMTPGASGWWQSDIPCRHGDEYGFTVDGEGPFADPRSPHQPAGVHGLSRWVDHTRFPWTDMFWQARPLASAVIYELHVGTFSDAGTFDGVIAHLEYLVALGVTHVELMPVAEFAGARGWGYDGVDLYAPHHAYGGPDGLKRLVDACHGRSLAVVLDVVFRLDAVHAFVDLSATPFLQQLSTEVRQLASATGRHLALIAEGDLNHPRLVRPVEAGGYGIDAQWADDVHHAVQSVITGERNGYYEDFGTSPFLYFTDHEAELGTLIGEGRRREFAQFGWDPATIPDPQQLNIFDRSRLQWDEVTQEPHVGMLQWYRALLALRRELPSLRDQPSDIHIDERRGLLRCSAVVS